LIIFFHQSSQAIGNKQLITFQGSKFIDILVMADNKIYQTIERTSFHLRYALTLVF